MNREWTELFDRGIDRRGTFCEKWDFNQKIFGREDVLPMWVADMDFASPDCVKEALVRRAAHGAYGYSDYDDEMFGALCDFMKARHGLSMQKDWALFSAGVVDSLFYTIKAVTKPGDRVILQTPVYGPFYRMTELAGCTVAQNPLLNTPEGYRMDLEGLEALLKDGARVMLLCSPHNPVGRVWTKAELSALVALLNRYEATLIADEIHGEFALPGHPHTTILTLDGAQKSILLVSATKTFNLAGLKTSSIIIADAALRAQVKRRMDALKACGPNIFGAVAQTAAYRGGGEWLDALNEYLDGNRAFAEQYFRENLPEITPARMEGTYLMWLDCRALGLEQDALKRFFTHRAGVGLTSGDFFGAEGVGYMRLNLAAPRGRVAEGLEKIAKAVKER